MYAEKEVERIERPIFLKGTNSERADDLPLIIHWLKQMEIASIIDQELAPPHGNRKGLSYGQLSVSSASNEIYFYFTQNPNKVCPSSELVSKFGPFYSKNTIMKAIDKLYKNEKVERIEGSKGRLAYRLHSSKRSHIL
ncbi:MAG: hypothetical protein QNJ55_17280 [Xenococcus sp. MO_188.B8]|nr:hypothetical protein [Xenococcus sp. MO_188.B8]